MNFNFNEYDEWLKNNDKTIFLSEYNAPFKEIMCINKRVTLSQTNQDSKGEKLFVNKIDHEYGQMKIKY